MALRDVNLVPEPVLQGRYARRHLVAWGVACLLVAAACAAAHVHFTRRALARGGAPVSEAEMRRRLVTAIVQVQDKMAEVERLAFARRMSRPVGAAHVLDALASHMDADTWLTALSLRERDGGGMGLVANGLCVSNAKLGLLIGDLTGDPLFASVVLRNAVEAGGGDRSGNGDGAPDALTSFTIQAELHGE